MFTLLVPFGLKEDKLYEPNQVMNGKACRCVCPACKKPLVAKQNATTPHFAHEQNENCSKGFETAVHMAVKQIIAEKMEVRLPALIWKSKIQRHSQVVKIYNEKLIHLQTVVLEQKVGDFKPDIVVTANNITYLIEVAVTHFIDESKLLKIDKRKIPTFEIDVSRLKNGFTLKELEIALFESINYQANWKYHCKLEQLDFEAILEEEVRISKIQEANKERLRKFERYRNLSPARKLQINLKSIGLTEQQMSSLTTFVPWEKSFGVPRIVWQSAVLAYIANVQKEQGWDRYLPCSINYAGCLNWIMELFDIKSVVKDGEKIAIWKYFNHLESVGVLKHLTHKDFDLLIGRQRWVIHTEQIASI